MTGKQAKQAARAGAAGLDLPVVREAQDRGELTVESTDAVVTAARRSDDPEVQQKVVESGVRLAKDQPTGKVKAFAERLVSHLDPAALQKGHAQEVEKRNVKLVPKPYGMAQLTAFGPAVELRTVMDGVEAAARKTAEFDKDLEVSRTPAQRSFDVFCSMWTPCDAPEERAKSVNQLMARPHMLIHVPAGTLLGSSDQPGWLSDDTPIPADVIRELAKDATWQALVEDAGRLVGLGDRVLQPGLVVHPADWPTGAFPNTTGGTATSPARMAAGSATGTPGALPDPADWPANTIASDSYQAGAKLRLLLEARDRGCVAPNCSAPPGRCEADHRVPYDPSRPAIEQTTGSNMQLLCKAHHQLKTHHGWAHNHDPATGQTTITPPHSPPVLTSQRE
jgi:hypothetical protein